MLLFEAVILLGISAEAVSNSTLMALIVMFPAIPDPGVTLLSLLEKLRKFEYIFN